MDVLVTTAALRLQRPGPPHGEPRLLAAVDDADPAVIDRNAIGLARAAMIASLWPEARPCVATALFDQLPAPALLGDVFRVSWRAPAQETALGGQAGAEHGVEIAWAA